MSQKNILSPSHISPAVLSTLLRSPSPLYPLSLYALLSSLRPPNSPTLETTLADIRRLLKTRTPILQDALNQLLSLHVVECYSDHDNVLLFTFPMEKFPTQ